MLLSNSTMEQIIDPHEARRLREEGWLAADLHVHSTCSPDVLPSPDFEPETIYQTCRQRGLHYITITDHDCADAFDQIGWQRENLVTGVEVTLNDPIRVGHTIHVNVYDFERWHFHELMKIARFDRNLETFIDFVKDQDLPYTYNHPFWFAQGESPNYRAVEEIIDLFPVIEYNMKRVRKRNLMALWLANKHNKGVIANTDTHIGEMGATYTLAQGETFREYFQNIADGNAYIVPQDMNVKNLNEEVVTWIETLFGLEEIDSKLRLTKVPAVDNMLNFFIQHSVTDYPKSFPLLKRSLCRFVRLGIITGTFIGWQYLNSMRIGYQLGIPQLLRVPTK